MFPHIFCIRINPVFKLIPLAAQAETFLVQFTCKLRKLLTFCKTFQIKDMETGIEEAVSNSGNIDKLVFGKQQEIEQVLQDIEDIKFETARISEELEKRKAEREELSELCSSSSPAFNKEICSS